MVKGNGFYAGLPVWYCTKDEWLALKDHNSMEEVYFITDMGDVILGTIIVGKYDARMKRVRADAHMYNALAMYGISNEVTVKPPRVKVKKKKTGPMNAVTPKVEQ